MPAMRFNAIGAPLTSQDAVVASSKNRVARPRQGKHMSRVTVGHHNALTTGLQRLMKGIKRGNLSPKQLYAMVKTAQSHAAGVTPFLTAKIAGKYHDELKHNDRRTAAQKVFSVCELVEAITLNLDVPDIVSMSGVNVLIRGTIEASYNVQAILPLVDAPTAMDHPEPFYAPFESCLDFPGGFVCKPDVNEYRARMVNKGNVLLIKANFPFSDEDSEEGEVVEVLPKIGSTYRNMFISEPPPTSMKVYVSCCDRYSYDYEKLCDDEIFAEDGMTIGDLHDCAQQVLAKHGEHYRTTEVRFEGYVPVAYNDEVLSTWSSEKMREIF